MAKNFLWLLFTNDIILAVILASNVLPIYHDWVMIWTLASFGLTTLIIICKVIFYFADDKKRNAISDNKHS